MIYEEMLNNDSIMENLESFKALNDRKLINIEKLIKSFETIAEAVSINPSIYHLNKIVSQLDNHLYISPYENFINDICYLTSYKDFEKFYIKKQTKELTEEENIIYQNALNNIGFVCFPQFLKKEDITPDNIKNSKNLINGLLDLNEKMLEIHNSASVLVVSQYLNTNNVPVNNLLKVFKYINFENQDEADKSISRSFEKITKRHDFSIKIKDSDILKFIGNNDLINTIDVKDLESGQHMNTNYTQSRFQLVSTLDIVKFFIKKAIYLGETGEAYKEYFHKDTFDIVLEERERLDSRKEVNVIVEMSNILSEILTIDLKISSSKLLKEEEIVKNLIESAYDEAKEFISLLKEKRYSSDYMEYSESIYNRIVCMAKDSKDFKKEYRDFQSYHTKDNMKEIFQKSRVKRR